MGGASAVHAASADIDTDRLGSLTVQVLSEPTPSAAPFSFGLFEMLPSGLVYVATPAPSVTLRPPSAQPTELLAGIDSSIDVSPGFVIMMLEDPGCAQLSAAGGHSPLDLTLSRRPRMKRSPTMRLCTTTATRFRPLLRGHFGVRCG